MSNVEMVSRIAALLSTAQCEISSARALGLEVPRTLLARADKPIE